MIWDGSGLLALKAQLERIDSPAPRMAPLETAVPAGMFRCVRCRRLTPWTEVRYLHTGILWVTDTLCPACRPEFDRMATIVCAGCKTVVARLAPYHDRKSGFRTLAGVCYHILECPLCNEHVVHSRLLEQQEYEKLK
jgi:hypothetical protein